MNRLEVPFLEPSNPMPWMNDSPLLLSIKTASLAARTVAFTGEDWMEIEDRLGMLSVRWDSQWHTIDDRFVKIWKGAARVYELHDCPEGCEEQAAEAFANILFKNRTDAVYMIPREHLDARTWCRHYRCLRLIRHYLRAMNEDGYTMDRFDLSD